MRHRRRSPRRRHGMLEKMALQGRQREAAMVSDMGKGRRGQACQGQGQRRPQQTFRIGGLNGHGPLLQFFHSSPRVRGWRQSARPRHCEHRWWSNGPHGVCHPEGWRAGWCQPRSPPSHRHGYAPRGHAPARFQSSAYQRAKRQSAPPGPRGSGRVGMHEALGIGIAQAGGIAAGGPLRPCACGRSAPLRPCGLALGDSRAGGCAMAEPATASRPRPTRKQDRECAENPCQPRFIRTF